MKLLCISILLHIFLSTVSFGQEIIEYPNNEDTLYSRKPILNTICKKLNRLHKYYLPKYSRRYKVSTENAYNFYIYDLVDTLNTTRNKDRKCIEFKNNHIYHIGSIRSSFEISVVLILLEGKLYFFEGLNCCKKKQTIEDVITWVEKQIPNKIDEITITRVRNFKKYSLSFYIDTQGKKPLCECRNP